MRDRRWIIAAFAAATLFVACGGSDPIAEVAAANAAVASQQDSVEAAEKVVATREEEVAEAQKRLSEATEALREEERELARLEADVDRSALDTALFREVQKRLLQDGELSSVAIVASVSGGIVTLTGSVDTDDLNDRAIEVAGETRGVGRVESRIRVLAPTEGASR